MITVAQRCVGVGAWVCVCVFVCVGGGGHAQRKPISKFNQPKCRRRWPLYVGWRLF